MRVQLIGKKWRQVYSALEMKYNLKILSSADGDIEATFRYYLDIFKALSIRFEEEPEYALEKLKLLSLIILT